MILTAFLATLLVFSEGGNVSLQGDLTSAECKAAVAIILSRKPTCMPTPHLDTPECKGISGTACGSVCSYHVSSGDIKSAECFESK